MDTLLAFWNYTGFAHGVQVAQARADVAAARR